MTRGIFITPASGIAAPQCGNYDNTLVAAKSEVGRSIMAAIPTTSGMVISVGIFLIATLGCGDPRRDPRYGSGSIGIVSSVRQSLGVDGGGGPAVF